MAEYREVYLFTACKHTDTQTLSQSFTSFTLNGEGSIMSTTETISSCVNRTIREGFNIHRTINGINDGIIE